jgi:hypothetical protein
MRNRQISESALNGTIVTLGKCPIEDVQQSEDAQPEDDVDRDISLSNL